MRMKSGTPKPSADRVVSDIRRKTRKRHSAEEKIRIVLEGLPGEAVPLGPVLEPQELADGRGLVSHAQPSISGFSRASSSRRFICRLAARVSVPR